MLLWFRQQGNGEDFGTPDKTYEVFGEKIRAYLVTKILSEDKLTAIDMTECDKNLEDDLQWEVCENCRKNTSLLTGSRIQGFRRRWCGHPFLGRRDFGVRT